MTLEAGMNRNRAHAVKQLKKGIRDADETLILASIANSYIYIGESLERIAKAFNKEDTTLLPVEDEEPNE